MKKCIAPAVCILFLQVSFVLSHPVLGQSDTDDDSILLDKNLIIGQKLGNEGKNEEALVYFKKVLRDYPNNRTSYGDMFGAYFNLKRYNEAIKAASKYIKKFPSRSEPYYFLGLACTQVDGRTEEGIAHYTKALSIDSMKPDYYYFRALAYHSLEKNELSLADYNKSVELTSTGAKRYVRTFYERAEVELVLLYYERAIADLRRYLTKGGTNDKTNYRLGVAYFGLYSQNERATDLDSCIYYLRKFNSETPGDPKGLVTLGGAYMSKGDSVNAEQNFRLALAVDKSNPDVLVGNGLFDLWQRRYERGEKEMLSALKDRNFRRRAETFYNLGLSKAMRRDSSAAMSYFKKAEKADSTLYVVYETRSFYNLQVFNGRYGDIIADLEVVLRNAKTNLRRSEVLRLMAVAAGRKSTKAETLAYIGKAIELSPQVGYLYEFRAALTLLKGDSTARDSVWNDLNKVISLDPASASVHLWLGVFYASYDKDFDKGCLEWQKGVDLGAAMDPTCKAKFCAGESAECTFLNGPPPRIPKYLY